MQIKEPINREASSKSIFSTNNRFLRSTFLERDWNDPTALESYVYTLHAQESLKRLSAGLNALSSLRAWRITGDYGSGKSSFALLAANVFSKRLTNIPRALKAEIRSSNPGLLASSQPKLMPILVTGSREPLGSAILNALLRTLKEEKIHGGFHTKLEKELQTSLLPPDEVVLDWIRRTNTYLTKNDKADGILVIIDEAGKFLEFAAMNPDKQDIYLLQRLAETASRSGKHPLYVLSIFHQGISAYAAGLSKVQQREWEKVAGRFDEIIWHFPVEQTAILIANALNTQLDRVPKQNSAAINKDMQFAIRLGWYGFMVNQASLTAIAERLYPIHPTVIPVLVKLFSNFGQNERSLYSFLLGTETFGLQEFVSKTNGNEFYRLHDLYDYARATFGGRLSSLTYHWKEIDGVINSYVTDEQLSSKLLKTVGILNLINSNDIPASKDLLSLSLSTDIEVSISSLEKLNLLHFRGHKGDYCLWPNTSVNVREVYSDAKKALGSYTELKSLIRERLELRPIVARRHYIQTGNLRYFEITYVDANALPLQNNVANSADGQLLVPLCLTLSDVEAATTFAQSLNAQETINFLMGIPRPLQGLASYLEEVQRWEWVERSVAELRQDRFAREEVSRQLNFARQNLQRHLQFSIGLTGLEKSNSLNWYHQGQLVSGISSGKDLMALLTRICDITYNRSPRIHNELINRRILSSAGAAARLRLCERLFEFADQPFLGMDAEKHPPEMSMYLSVLQEAGLHKEDESGSWGVRLPEEEYDNNHCRILPAMNCIHEMLLGLQDKRVPITTIFKALRAAPYGVRDGVTPLLLAVFAVIHEQEIAFYEDGTFIPRVTGTSFLRLIKAPETFEIQYYPISSVRSKLFKKLVEELKLRPNTLHNPDILDVVKPLIVFMGALPEYVLHTTNLTPQAQVIRSLLLKTTDPVKLLFNDLPKACGVSEILEIGEAAPDEIRMFAERLRMAIDEIRSSYPLLIDSLQKMLLKEFGLEGSLEKNRLFLGQRAQGLAGFVSEIRLKSFSLRLADSTLPRDLWIESLGNLLCSMPPSKWRDKDVFKFEQEIHKLTSQFLRVEATVFGRTAFVEDVETIRVALTRPNGVERDEVFHLSAEEASRVHKLEEKLFDILEQEGTIGMAAASRVLWRMMERGSKLNTT